MSINNFLPPFRVGRKQQRAVLDANSKEVVVFPKGLESRALEYADFLNKNNESQLQEIQREKMIDFANAYHERALEVGRNCEKAHYFLDDFLNEGKL